MDRAPLWLRSPRALAIQQTLQPCVHLPHQPRTASSSPRPIRPMSARCAMLASPSAPATVAWPCNRGRSSSLLLFRTRRFSRTLATAAAETVTKNPSQDSGGPDGDPGLTGGGPKRRARLSASREATMPIVEREKPLQEYMSLPASQYSVLDARKIERVDDTTFVCYVGELRFFNFRVEPVLTVSVETKDRGCVIRLLSCKLQGSRVVESQNEKFSATMENDVTWRALDAPESGSAPSPGKEIVSRTTVTVDLVVPGWFAVPVPAIERTGSAVMQSVVNRMVPRFLAQLERDYALWASGDTSRRPLSDGGL